MEIWIRERIAEEALKYTTRNEFSKKSPSVYNSALQYSCIDDVCGHMTGERNPAGFWTKERCTEEARKNLSAVYVISNAKTKTAYVGVSGNPHRRIIEHKATGRKEIRDLLSSADTVVMLKGIGLDGDGATRFEADAMAELKALGFTLLNKSG